MISEVDVAIASTIKYLVRTIQNFKCKEVSLTIEIYESTHHLSFIDKKGGLNLLIFNIKFLIVAFKSLSYAH